MKENLEKILKYLKLKINKPNIKLPLHIKLPLQIKKQYL
jgi:hypothetical protein